MKIEDLGKTLCAVVIALAPGVVKAHDRPEVDDLGRYTKLVCREDNGKVDSKVYLEGNVLYHGDSIVPIGVDFRDFQNDLRESIRYDMNGNTVVTVDYAGEGLAGEGTYVCNPGTKKCSTPYGIISFSEVKNLARMAFETLKLAINYNSKKVDFDKGSLGKPRGK